MYVKNNIDLSILIPCYNWDVQSLINHLHSLCVNSQKLNKFEIICIDDASKDCFANNKISELHNVTYRKLNKNIGRSKIRNLMAHKAQYEWLLFIDADSEIYNSFFINKYLNAISKPIDPKTLYYGSTMYNEKQPNKEKILHWKYGKKVESKRKKHIFSSHHFLIQRKLFSKEYNIKFNETITSYGYEDTFFVNDNTLKTIYIDNPLYHIGLKDTDKFISDTEHALHNLIRYSKLKKITKQIKIIKIANLLSNFNIEKVIITMFKIFKPLILKNLYSKNPLIICIQFYKLGYFLTHYHNSN